MGKPCAVALIAPLFVPAIRPDRFAKAAVSGADAIIVDLEDAVAPMDKLDARKSLSALVEVEARTFVRINAQATPWFDGDMRELQAHGVKLVCVPKVETLSVLDHIRDMLGPEVAILAQIETARGLLNSAEIAGHPNVGQLAFGPADFFMDTGCSPSRQLVSYALNVMAISSGARGIALPLDGPCFSVGSIETIADECTVAKQSGAGGKLCIHPSQAPAVIRAFLPSEDDLAWARRVVEADQGGAAQLVDGRMIDAPIVMRARKLLDQAARSEQ